MYSLNYTKYSLSSQNNSKPVLYSYSHLSFVGAYLLMIMIMIMIIIIIIYYCYHYYYYYSYHFCYNPDCRPQIGEHVTNNRKAPTGKTAQLGKGKLLKNKKNDE